MDSPCTGWAPTNALCSTWGTVDPAVQAYANRVATLVLWSATGRRYGLCSVTVRPCQAQQEPLYVAFPASPVWALYSVASGVVVSSLYAWCCSGACACSPSEVVLPGPVASVTQVRIDGAVLGAGNYRLDGARLVRTDGSSWPTVQNLGVAEGQPNTWAVDYQLGVAVPAELNDAAGVYACEVAKARTGGTCRLPQRVRSISRQGVDIQLMDAADWLDKGLTGLTEVDMVIRAVNPFGNRQPPRVLSLDVPEMR
jgi:hypothetical protein